MTGDATKAFSIGEAGHITASSPDGPRFNSELTSEDRRSAKNGIWLCGNCHTEVDSDTSHYTIAQLKQYKSDAERQQEERYRSCEINEDSFVILSPPEPLGVASYVLTPDGERQAASIIDSERDKVTYYEGSAYVVRCLMRKKEHLDEVLITAIRCRVDEVSPVPEYRPLYGVYPTETSLLFIDIDLPEKVGRNSFLCTHQFCVTGKLQQIKRPFTPVVLDDDEWVTLDIRINARTHGLYTITLEMTTAHVSSKRTEVILRREQALFLDDQD